ncbi:MAG: hypothetical protein AAGA91_17450 [Pseudomonadota bacterium]
MHKLPSTIVTLLLMLLAASANAGIIRYDMVMPRSDFSEATGFMLFQDPVNDGNIMPYLADWSFYDPAFGGLTYDSSNTVSAPENELFVDDQGNFVSSNLLCFGVSSDACEGAIGLGLVYFSAPPGSTIFIHPGSQQITVYGSPVYSDPISVDSPGTLAITGLALLVISVTRRARRQ